jgi:hypothetical protein
MSAYAGWHAKELGDALMAHVELGEIESAVLAAQRDKPEKSGLAVFTRHDSEGRLQCAVTAYFSPAAAALANRFHAVPCRSPARGELTLLCGDPEAWMLLRDTPV